MCMSRIISGLNRDGMDLCQMGDFQGAKSLLEDALERARFIGSKCFESKILNNLGIVCELEGNRVMAADCFSQAVDVLRGGRLDGSPLDLALRRNLERMVDPANGGGRG